MLKLEGYSVHGLLKTHAAIGKELHTRGVVRTANNPVGDLAEFLFCQACGWNIAPNSEKGFDATDLKEQRIQIKGRRLLSPNASRQMSAIRNIDKAPFDLLAGVLFNADYSILGVILVPLELVQKHSTYSLHTNSNIFYLRSELWQLAGTRDVTKQLQGALRKI